MITCQANINSFNHEIVYDADIGKNCEFRQTTWLIPNQQLTVLV